MSKNDKIIWLCVALAFVVIIIVLYAFVLVPV